MKTRCSRGRRLSSFFVGSACLSSQMDVIKVEVQKVSQSLMVLTIKLYVL